MRLIQILRRICLLCGLLIIPYLAGCDVLPTITLNASTPTSPTTAWKMVATGVDTRTETWRAPDDNAVNDTVTIVRFNPKNVQFSVAYQPDSPLSIQDWIKQEQNPLALINGGYFDGTDHTTAMVISDGDVSGTSYQGFGGMFDVNAQGNIQLRSLHDQPYDSSEHLTQATQCTPMLLLNGKTTTFSADNQASPRSVIALDKSGNLLFIVSPGLTFTLKEMATLLAQSDLNLVTALNLDGGSSTGLYVNSPQQGIAIDSYVNLPIVIVVREKK